VLIERPKPSDVGRTIWVRETSGNLTSGELDGADGTDLGLRVGHGVLLLAWPTIAAWGYGPPPSDDV